MRVPRMWGANDERRLRERHFEEPTVAHPRGVRTASYFAAWHLPGNDLFDYEPNHRDAHPSHGPVSPARVLCGEDHKGEGSSGFTTELDRTDDCWMNAGGDELRALFVTIVAPNTKACMHCLRAFAKQYVGGPS